LIEIAGPAERKLLNPAIALAEEGESGFELGKRVEGERDALEIEVHGVLIAVDVMVEHAEPFALERRESHKTERVGEGAVEAVFDEVPGERSDGGGETLGGLVAGPARGNGGDGAGLEEEKFARGDAPFDVLREVVVVFDAESERSDLGDLVGGERGGNGFLGGERNSSDGGGSRRCRAEARRYVGRGKGDDFVGLGADVLLAKGEGEFVEGELVNLGFAADDGFTEAEVGVDEKFGEIAGDRIDGEGDAGDIAGNHLLNDDGHGGLVVGEIELRTIGDGAIGEEREEAGFDGCEDAGFADAVEEGFVLASESGKGEVFESGRGADGERLVGRKVGEGFAKFGLEFGGERELREIVAKSSGFGSESGGVVEREGGEFGEEIGGGGDEFAEGLGAHDETARDGEAGLGEFGEIGALAAGVGDLRGERVAEVEDVGHGRHQPLGLSRGL